MVTFGVCTKPNISIDYTRHLIIIRGHYSDTVKCAKLTLLCEKYGATVLKDGYAEVPYSSEFIKDLQYINTNKHFFVVTGSTLLAIGIILSALATGAGTAAGISAGNVDATSKENKELAEWVRKNYPDLTENEVQGLVSKYGEDNYNLLDPNTWADVMDKEGLKNELADIQKLYDELGYAPEMLTADQLSEIESQAKAEIDAENHQLFDLFDQTTQRANNLLEQQSLENQQAFADYRNQLLTNEAMNQQMIAGSTRYELQRAQRTAIIRGASAAQRLVANINTQLGMQAKAAQQSLDTSNALAQQLLMHRQAQQNLRSDYMNQLNQNAMNRAGIIKGSAERRSNYANSQLNNAINRNQYERDAWNTKVSDYFSGDSLGESMYRRQYGSKPTRPNNGGY